MPEATISLIIDAHECIISCLFATDFLASDSCTAKFVGSHKTDELEAQRVSGKPT